MNVSQLIERVTIALPEFPAIDSIFLADINTALLSLCKPFRLSGLVASADIIFAGSGTGIKPLPANYDHDVFHAESVTNNNEPIRIRSNVQALYNDYQTAESRIGDIVDIATSKGNISPVRAIGLLYDGTLSGTPVILAGKDVAGSVYYWEGYPTLTDGTADLLSLSVVAEGTDPTLSGTPKIFCRRDSNGIPYYWKGYVVWLEGRAASLYPDIFVTDADATLSGTPKIFSAKDVDGNVYYWKGYPATSGTSLSVKDMTFLHCLPIPASDETVRIRFYREPTKLINDTDIPEGIPDYLQEDLLVGYVVKNKLPLVSKQLQLKLQHYINDYNTALKNLQDCCRYSPKQKPYIKRTHVFF